MSVSSEKAARPKQQNFPRPCRHPRIVPRRVWRGANVNIFKVLRHGSRFRFLPDGSKRSEKIPIESLKGPVNSEGRVSARRARAPGPPSAPSPPSVLLPDRVQPLLSTQMLPSCTFSRSVTTRGSALGLDRLHTWQKVHATAERASTAIRSTGAQFQHNKVDLGTVRSRGRFFFF